MNDKEKLERYEELKIMVREAEKEMEELKPAIMPYVPDDEYLKTERGYFYIQKRPTYTFSPETKQLKKDLKKAEDTEKKDGTAKVTYSDTLYYSTGEPKIQE